MSKRYNHNLSNKHSSTCKLGQLIPVNLFEVIPGDIIKGDTTSLVRLTPLLAPQLTTIEAYVAHYYVPFRLIWDDFEDFITGGESGNEAPTLPTINLGTVAKSSLADYFGIPLGVANTTVNALPFRAYASVWNEHFADFDINTDLVIDKTSGADTTTSTTLKRVNWAKDNYTSAKPWAQRGTAISLPLGTTAPVIGTAGSITSNSNTPTITGPGVTNQKLRSDAVLRDNFTTAGTFSSDGDVIFGDESGLQITGTSLNADLTSATSASIVDLREAFGLQKFLERQAAAGGRYDKYLGQWGIASLDARLQRPEYLGGGHNPIQISEIVQTGVDSGDAGVGNLKGHGIGGIKSNRFTKFIPEHGYIISFVYLRPQTHYLDGLDRLWSRTTRTDFYDPDLAEIGMDTVLNKEVYLGHSSPEGVHGYNHRYHDYRQKRNVISGDFRDSVANFWHLARDFSGDTALNETFIECNPGARIFAEQTEDHAYLLVSNNVIAKRMIKTVKALNKR